MNKLDILVVDDDRDLAKSLEEVLEEAGHTVTLAFSGAQALERSSSHCFDLILMDIRMPGMTGIESLITIKKEKPAARVLLMTGFSVAEVLDQAIDEGALGVLHKPIQPDDLLETLQQVNPEAAVLLVDDDPDFSAAISLSLQEAGYRVIQARDGETALDIAETRAIETVVLDLRLPERNGLETYLEMKKRGKHVPTVVISAYLEEEYRQLEVLKKENVMHVLRKPFDVDLLFNALKDVTRPVETPAD